MVVYSLLCVLSSLLLTAAEDSVAVDQTYSHSHDNNFDDDILYNDIYMDEEELEDTIEETTLWTTIRQATTITPSSTHTELSTVYVPSSSSSTTFLNPQKPEMYANTPSFLGSKNREAPIRAAGTARKGTDNFQLDPISDSRMKVPGASNPIPERDFQPVPTKQLQRSSIFPTPMATNNPMFSPEKVQKFVVTRPAKAPHIAKPRSAVTVTTTVMGGAIFDTYGQRNFANPKARLDYRRDSVAMRAKEFRAMPVRFDTSNDDGSINDDTDNTDDSNDSGSSSSTTSASSTLALSSTTTAQPTDNGDDSDDNSDPDNVPTTTTTSDCGCEATSTPENDCDSAPNDEEDAPDCEEDNTPDCSDDDDTPDCPEEEDDGQDCCSVHDNCCPVQLDVIPGGCDFDHQFGDDTMEFILNTKDHIRDRVGCAGGKVKQVLSHLRPHHVHERVHQVVHDERPMISDQNRLLHDKKGRVKAHHRYASYEHARAEKQARKDRLIRHAACNGECPPVDDDLCEPSPKILKYRPQKALRKQTCCAPPVRDVCAPPVRDVCAPPMKAACPPPVKAACAPPVKAACRAPPVKDTCPAPQKAKKAACAAPPVKDTCPAPQKVRKDTCTPPVKAACPAPPVKDACSVPQKAKKAPCAAPQKAKKASCAPPVKDACAPPQKSKKSTCKAVCAPPVRDVCAPVRDVCDDTPVVRDIGSSCDFDHQFGDDAMSFIIDSKDHVRGCLGGAKQQVKQALSHFSPGHIHERLSQLLHDRRPIISDENLALHDRKGRSPSRRDRACGC